MEQSLNFNPFELINNKLEGIDIKLQEALEAQANGPKVEIIDGETLCERFAITRQTLGRWRSKNRIPFIQIGSVIRYDFYKVIEALEEGRGL